MDSIRDYRRSYTAPNNYYPLQRSASHWSVHSLAEAGPAHRSLCRYMARVDSNHNYSRSYTSRRNFLVQYQQRTRSRHQMGQKWLWLRVGVQMSCMLFRGSSHGHRRSCIVRCRCCLHREAGFRPRRWMGVVQLLRRMTCTCRVRDNSHSCSQTGRGRYSCLDQYRHCRYQSVLLK